MPWTCEKCSTDVQDDDPLCPSCAAPKTSWTMVADKTRTLVLSGRKVTYLRGHRINTYAPDHEAHALVPRAHAEVAPVIRKVCAGAIAERGHQPPSWHTLHVRLHPGARKQVALTVSVNFEGLEVEDHDLTQDVPAELRPDGSFDARILLVHGKGPLPAEGAFPGISVIDITEVGHDGALTFAPSIDIAALGKAAHQLPTEDAGALELGTVWFQAFDALDEAPIADALVHLRAEDELLVVGATDEEGCLRWPQVPLGFVGAELDGYEELAVPVLDPDEPEEPYRAWFVPRTGTLSVQAFDERHEPLPDVPYRLEGRVELTGTTDADARLEHPGVPHGIYTLLLEGHAPTAVPTLDDPEQGEAPPEPHRALLHPGAEPGTIALQVFDAEGAPLAGAAYRIEGPLELEGTTDDRGSLRHEHVPLEYYALLVDGFAPVAFPALADPNGSYALQVQA